jgi:hypothetical protein
MNCQTAQELLPASLLDALEVDEELALLDHLQACVACRAEADALRPVANSIGLAARDAGQPSPEVRLHMLARIGSVPKPQTALLPQRRSIFRPIAALVPAAIALALIFGLGAAVISLQGQLSQQQEQVAQQQARLDRLTQQQVALRQFMLDAQMQPVALKIDSPQADAVAYVSNDTIALAVTGLPTLTGDSVYQCWWIDTSTGEVKPGSTFRVDANGAGVWAWARPDGLEYDQMAVTLESQTGHTKPEGSLVMTAEF